MLFVCVQGWPVRVDSLTPGENEVECGIYLVIVELILIQMAGLCVSWYNSTQRLEVTD